ncbi:HNH endonuclease [Nonomuraea sp. NPDC048901]|uniref:HNH endonuclease n=1 Tax=Nonomuraea sp. NPDC048901 TaxID=3155627 RepID=UPI00340088BE
MAVSKRLRHEIFRRDNHTCQSCGAKAPDVKLEPDHVIPTALGGSDEPSNLRTLCADCNSGKSATPPDAATVAKVADDAMRWSLAIQAAAGDMLGKRKGRDEARAAFDAKWKSWSEGRPALPRPSDWETSVDNFLKAGLPLPVLLDCIGIAMSARQVKADDVFKYMCGAAWKEVAKLQNAARAHLRPEPSPPPASASPRPERAGEVVAAVVELFTDEECKTYVVDPVAALDLELDEEGRYPIVEAVESVLWGLRSEIDALQAQTQRLLEELPDGLGWQAMKLARFELYDYPGADWSKHLFTQFAVHAATSLIKARRALEYLKDMPLDELHEWEELAKNLDLATSDPRWSSLQLDRTVRLFKVASMVKEVREHRRYWPPMCSAAGRLIPLCAEIATHVGVLGHMDCCVGQNAADHGHPLCERHVTQLVDGEYVNRQGVLVSLLDYREIDTSTEST